MNGQAALPPPDALDDAGALFLDLDGTLAPIEQRPQDVGPVVSRSRLLRAVAARLGGRLAVISGRTIADIDRILDGAVAAVAGVHGLEHRWSDGRVTRAEPDPGLAAAKADLQPLMRRYAGLQLEDKGLALCVHYRAQPEAAEAVRTAAGIIAGRTGLVIQAGDMVVEFRGLGPRKGDAVTAFMHTPPFKGSRPIFVGDDLTDEDGFSAARALGGEGVLVGPARQTAATRRLPDIDAVLDWLGAAVNP